MCRFFGPPVYNTKIHTAKNKKLKSKVGMATAVTAVVNDRNSPKTSPAFPVSVFQSPPDTDPPEFEIRSLSGAEGPGLRCSPAQLAWHQAKHHNTAAWTFSDTSLKMYRVCIEQFQQKKHSNIKVLPWAWFYGFNPPPPEFITKNFGQSFHCNSPKTNDDVQR